VRRPGLMSQNAAALVSQAVHHPEDLPDAVLLERTATHPEAFGVFYRRHVAAVVGFLLARTRDREVAADLTGETFAAALSARTQFDPRRGPARAWLYAIARHALIDSVRRGQVEERARRALGVRPLEVGEDDLARVDELAAVAAEGEAAEDHLGALEPGTREAVEARVIAERDYADIALQLHCSEAVVRKRVSRGLAALRERLEGAR
jgi:RNA polymerase sigma factor (sigma-70 family)